MTKKDRVREAYGDKLSICNPDENGWTDSKTWLENGLTLSASSHIHQGGKIRPKSLQGIENNNGWIKIESEDDLPKEDKWYWVKKKSGEEILSGYQIGVSKERWLSEITHYQPIEKPKPPIY